jgi:hypothetical protein
MQYINQQGFEIETQQSASYLTVEHNQAERDRKPIGDSRSSQNDKLEWICVVFRCAWRDAALVLREK